MKDWGPGDLMDEMVRMAVKRECEIVERLVEEFLSSHPMLGGDDIVIECVVSPDGIERMYRVREK